MIPGVISDPKHICTGVPQGFIFGPLLFILGASSDGRVTEYGSVGVLEIKCPYSVQGKLVNKMEVLDIVAMNNTEFCLEFSTEGIRMKKTHK